MATWKLYFLQKPPEIDYNYVISVIIRRWVCWCLLSCSSVPSSGHLFSVDGGAVVPPSDDPNYM